MAKATIRKIEAICGIFLLLFVVCCSKDKQKEQYGVSISAPSIAGTPAEIFSQEHIALFRMANGLNFELIRNTFQSDSSSDNQACSVLYLLKELCLTGTDEDYLKALEQYCAFSDTRSENLKNNFLSLEQTMHSIDSTLIFSTRTDTSKIGEFKCEIDFLLPLMYEDALSTAPAFFSDCNLKKTKRNFFRLSGNFNTLATEEETISDIPIGNGNYSLLLIMPNEKQIRDYLKELTEQKYKKLTDRMEKRKTSITFPSFEDFSTETEILLPDIIISDTVIRQHNITKLHTKIQLQKPTEALLQSMQKSMEDKIIDAKNEEDICFNKPFLFFLKGSNSGAIILQGIYRK